MTDINIKDLSFNISNYCLGSCINCTLWQSKHWKLDDEMNLETINKNFLSSPVLDNLSTIHITGGSPVLSPKFLSVCEMIRDYHGDVPVNSPVSGLYPEVMRQIFKRVVHWLPQYRLNIAVEGGSKEVHESVRGEDSWWPMWKTVKYMKDLGVNFRFNFTAYPNNYKDMPLVKKLAEQHGVGFYVNFGRYSRRFGHDVDSMGPEVPESYINEIERLITETGWLHERKLNEQRWVLQKAFWEGKKVRFQCRGGQEHIDVDPYGNVFPCLMYPMNYELGNLKQETLDTIMHKHSTTDLLGKVYSGTCSEDCPFTCMLRIDNVYVDDEVVWNENPL